MKNKSRQRHFWLVLWKIHSQSIRFMATAAHRPGIASSWTVFSRAAAFPNKGSPDFRSFMQLTDGARPSRDRISRQPAYGGYGQGGYGQGAQAPTMNFQASLASPLGEREKHLSNQLAFPLT